MALEEIFHDGILVDVHVSFWSGGKVLEPQDLGMKEDDVTEAFHLGKKMLIPPEVIHAFRALEARARRTVEVHSFPFPIGHARFVTRKSFKVVLKSLKELQASYGILADDLVTNYETYRQQMIPLYRQAAETAWTNKHLEVTTFGTDLEDQKQAFIQGFLDRVATYYPPAATLRSRFSLSWNVFEISLPTMGETDGDTVIADQETREELNRMSVQKISGWMDDIVKMLRVETSDLCSHVINNIKSGKVVKTQTLDSLKDHIERFKSLNFIGDVEVEKKLDSLRSEFLDKYDASALKNTELQEQLTRKLGELTEIVDSEIDVSQVTGSYKRKIDWRD